MVRDLERDDLQDFLALRRGTSDLDGGRWKPQGQGAYGNNEVRAVVDEIGILLEFFGNGMAFIAFGQKGKDFWEKVGGDQRMVPLEDILEVVDSLRCFLKERDYDFEGGTVFSSGEPYDLDGKKE